MLRAESGLRSPATPSELAKNLLGGKTSRTFAFEVIQPAIEFLALSIGQGKRRGVRGDTVPDRLD